MKRQTLPFLKNEAGFGFVEVVLATGLMSLLVGSALMLPPMFSRSSGALDSKFGQIKLQKDLREVFMHQSTCAAAMISTTFNPNGPTQFRINFNGANLSAAPGEQDLPAYGVRVTQFDLVNPRLVASLNATDAVYSARVQVGAQALKGGQASQLHSMNIGTVYLQTSSGAITNCLTGQNETDSAAIVCMQLGGIMTSGVCRVTPLPTTIMCPDGQYLQGFDAAGNKTCVNVPVVVSPTPTPTPTATPTPAMTWTWQGLLYQTTCPMLCDGVEWATCTGPACPFPRIQCYTASPRFVPGHPIGTTQSTTPTGYMCFPI